jgi:hypothetical protein
MSVATRAAREHAGPAATAALVMAGYRGGQNVYEHGIGVNHF